MGRAKGTNLHHMSTFVERRFGARGWSRMLERLDEETAAEVSIVVPVRWYDLGVQHRVLGSKHVRGTLADVEPFDPLFGRYLHAYIHRMFELTGARELKSRHRVELAPPRVVIEGRWE